MLSIHDKPFFSKNEDKVKIIFAVLECWQEIAAVYSDNIVNESSEEEKTAIKCHWGRLIKDLFQGLLDKEPHMQRVQPCQIDQGFSARVLFIEMVWKSRQYFC